MKLKDFLKEFEGVDPEADIVFQTADGCCADQHYLEDPSVDPWEYTHPKTKVTDKGVYVSFPALPHFKSCRRAGAMNDLLRKFEKDSENK